MKTNQILKNMVSKINKSQKRNFVRLLGIDVQTYEPTNMVFNKYKASLKDNIFLYIDEKYNLLGVLKGNDGFKTYSKYTTYDKYLTNYPYNRKHLTQQSKYILMIDKEDIKENLNYKSLNNKKLNHKQELRKRLEKYKTDKNEKYSHDDILKIMQEILSFCNSNLFMSESDIKKYFRNVFTFDRTMFDIIRCFAEHAKDYTRYYNQYLENKQYRIKNNGYCYDSYIKSKNNIIDWYKIIKSIK